LSYHRYDATGTQIGGATLKIAMRVWYPDELISMIESNGFSATARFGGYAGEQWKNGPELVVVLKHGDHK
jgi:hypothetical protein